MTETPSYHIPALLDATLDSLDIKPAGVYVDATFGGGGHSRAILSRLGNQGRLIVFDQDMDAFRHQQSLPDNLLSDPRVTAVNANFRYLKRFLRYYGIDAIDGLLADIGVSFHHFDDGSRGFSFRSDAPLDMRMNRSSALTAHKVINTWDEQRLADMFYLYGELRQARRIASAICRQREKSPIMTTAQLADTVNPTLKNDREKKELACVFQAVRISVNDEMGALRDLLTDGTALLKTGGRFAVLAYHSLEDRMVKNYFKTGNVAGNVEKDFYGNLISPLKPLGNKAITASDEEIALNPRARSARLRAAEKTNRQ